jgi:glycosyltransferase involved in cell wall biosynthesis
MQPKVLMKKSSHIIAVSEHTKNDIVERYGIEEHDISVVYLGVASGALPASSLDVARVKKQYALPERFVLFFGALEPRKNIPSIIEAFSAIADRVPHHLVIAGERGWKLGEITSAIERSLYKDKIHVIGFVQEQDKSSLYAAADLFVYPSFYEGFGFPPLEALMQGTPTVASFNASLPEVVGQWATLIDPYNTPQLALVLAELLRSPERVPFSVREQIQERFSWIRAARQTVKILENAV